MEQGALFSLEQLEPIHQVKQRGHPARPGSGPTGKTCNDCAHYRRAEYHNKIFRKCAQHKNWSHGAGTDIRASDPACSVFMALEEGIVLGIVPENRKV